jgi:hypothetical protein
MLVQASTGNVGTIIETFVVRQFLAAVGHYWVINETPWDGDEMIVDVHTIMNERRATEPTLSHFLLLLVTREFSRVRVFRSSQELTAEPKKRFKRSSSPPIHRPLPKKPPPAPRCRREGGGHSHLPRTII